MLVQLVRARTSRKVMERRGKKARREMVRKSMARVARTMNVAGKGQGTQKFDGHCNYCKKYGHMARDCRKKKSDEAQKQKNVGAVDQSSVKSTSSTANVGAVALNSTGHGDF